MSSERTRAQRQSGIELLKIIAMFMIVLSHAAQSLGGTQVGFIDLSLSTYNPQYLGVFFFRCLGSLGNLMFLIPSVWFLLNAKKVKINKIAGMIADVFFVSIIILIVYIYVIGRAPTAEEVIRSFFPTIYANNWYVTCYLLLYAIFPFLNSVIEHIDQKTHLVYGTAFFVLYCLINFVRESFFYGNLIGFVGIYFMVAYCKKYMLDFFSSKKVNLLLLAFGMAGWVGLVLLTNFLGNRFELLHDKMLKWSTFINPFFLLIAFSLFNLLRLSPLQSKAINYLSSLSLLIYIIHENYLFRTRIRPLYYVYIYTEFSYEYLIGWTLLYAVLLFLGSALLAMLYGKFLQPTVHKIGEKVLARLLKIYAKFEAAALKIK